MIYIIYIIITNLSTDITNLSKSVSEESASNVLISGLVPRKGYLNAKVRNINNDNVLALNPKNCHFMTLGNGDKRTLLINYLNLTSVVVRLFGCS